MGGKAITPELLELKERIEAMSPADRLRLAADLLERGQVGLAETIVDRVVGELTLVRLMGGRGASGRRG